MRRALFVAVLCTAPFVEAYPEMVKHGYTKCSTCHFSVNGGDLVTMYGRALGREVFAPAPPSATGAAEEVPASLDGERAEGGLIGRGPEWLRWGLNARLLQTYVDNSLMTRGRFLIMQADLDAVATLERWKVYTSVGRYEPKSNQADPNDFSYFPRAWVSYDLMDGSGDAQLVLKGGRFYPAYGLMIPEHIYVTRALNAFGPGQERKALELAWVAPFYEIVFTRIEGRYQHRQEAEEKGAVAQLALTPTPKLKLGMNAYRSTMPGDKVTAMDGLFALAGLDDHWSLLLQVDRLYPGAGKTGVTALAKLDYEWSPGLNLFATEEYSSPDTEKTDPHFDALGLGAQYHFTPELELTATARLEKNSGLLNEHAKVFWAILHWSPN